MKIHENPRRQEMNQNKQIFAVFYAILAAIFYAVNTPFSKLLLESIGPSSMAGFLYLGAGLGISILYLFNYKKEDPAQNLRKEDLPYVLGMIFLDIAAPILLMAGISLGSAANASLLGNFEIVATTLLAYLLFHEKVSLRLWLGIFIIALASFILSFEGQGSLDFSYGSILVLGATLCWGLENNCTRKISGKSPYQIVLLKGIFSGGGALVIGKVLGEDQGPAVHIVLAMVLGFVAYGLSIFFYVRAQRQLGAAKTSAYYSIAPFVAAFLAFVVNGESLESNFILALVIMVLGSLLVVYDTLLKEHSHSHTHVVAFLHDGHRESRVIRHSHPHKHFIDEKHHGHSHSFSKEDLGKAQRFEAR